MKTRIALLTTSLILMLCACDNADLSRSKAKSALEADFPPTITPNLFVGLSEAQITCAKNKGFLQDYAPGVGGIIGVISGPAGDKVFHDGWPRNSRSWVKTKDVFTGDYQIQLAYLSHVKVDEILSIADDTRQKGIKVVTAKIHTVLQCSCVTEPLPVYLPDRVAGEVVGTREVEFLLQRADDGWHFYQVHFKFG